MKKKAPNLLEEKRKAERVNAFDVAIIGAGYAGLSAALANALVGLYCQYAALDPIDKQRFNTLTRVVVPKPPIISPEPSTVKSIKISLRH